MEVYQIKTAGDYSTGFCFQASLPIPPEITPNTAGKESILVISTPLLPVQKKLTAGVVIELFRASIRGEDGCSVFSKVESYNSWKLRVQAISVECYQIPPEIIAPALVKELGRLEDLEERTGQTRERTKKLVINLLDYYYGRKD